MKVRAGAFAQVARSTRASRQLSFGLVSASGWACWSGSASMRPDGGAAAVGAVTAARMIPPRWSRRSPRRWQTSSAESWSWSGSGACERRRWARPRCSLALGSFPARCTARDHGDDRAGAVPARTLHAAARALHVAAAADKRDMVRRMLDSMAALGGPLVATVLLRPRIDRRLRRVRRGVARRRPSSSRLPYDVRHERRLHSDQRTPTIEGFSAYTADPGLLLITALAPRQTLTRRCPDLPSPSLSPSSCSASERRRRRPHAAVGAGAVLGSILTFALRPARGLAAWFGFGSRSRAYPGRAGRRTEVPATIVLFGWWGSATR